MISGSKRDAAEAISRWNPFEDTTPFSQVVTEEEDLFGAEFDKIRQEGGLVFNCGAAIGVFKTNKLIIHAL